MFGERSGLSPSSRIPWHVIYGALPNVVDQVEFNQSTIFTTLPQSTYLQTFINVPPLVVPSLFHIQLQAVLSNSLTPPNCHC